MLTPRPPHPPELSPSVSGDVERSGRKTRRARLTMVALGSAAVLVALAVVLIRSRRAQAPIEASTRDVPRLDGTSVVFSRAFKERAGLDFSKVESVPFKPTVRVVGTVAFNPSYVAAIGTRLRGTVRRTFKYEGDVVTAGEALAEVESVDLAEAQSSVIQAEASLRTAEVQAKREKELLEKSLTTAREAEIAATEFSNQSAGYKAAQQRVRAFGGGGAFGSFVMRSPIAGHVIERSVAPGQSVDGSIVGYRVADLEHLWIELSVFERDLRFVHLDDDVEVSPLAEPDVKIVGKVAHVGEIIDPTTRSTDVRVRIDHPKYHLRQGQSVHAKITTSTASRNALLVPHSAVVHVDGRPTVFVAESETRVKPVTVKLGGSDGANHEIVDGIVAGQLVATAGVFALKSELFR